MSFCPQREAGNHVSNLQRSTCAFRRSAQDHVALLHELSHYLTAVGHSMVRTRISSKALMQIASGNIQARCTCITCAHPPPSNLCFKISCIGEQCVLGHGLPPIAHLPFRQRVGGRSFPREMSQKDSATESTSIIAGTRPKRLAETMFGNSSWVSGKFEPQQNCLHRCSGKKQMVGGNGWN